jgi:pimeloyl-ACP methyl ester carboxylesterase
MSPIFNCIGDNNMRVLIAGLAMAVLLFAVDDAGAQDQPTVFIHGLGSSADTWTQAAERLGASLQIETHARTTNWRETYVAQAAELESVLGNLPPTTIAVGHSNGGVIARQWNRTRPLGAIVTLGTPHQGAPFIQNVFEWAGFYDDKFISAIDAVYGIFGNNCCEWAWILEQVNEVLDPAYAVTRWSIARAAGAIGIYELFPIFFDMVPNSQFLTGLNSSANLAREADAVPVRVGVVSVARDYYWGGVFRSWRPNEVADRWATLRDAGAYGLVAGAVLVHAYADPNNVTAHRLADHMDKAAGVMLELDQWYCEAISWPGGGQCWANDTIVPVWSQDYRRLGGTLIFTGPEGPRHLDQTTSSDEWLEDALRRLAQVPPRQ